MIQKLQGAYQRQAPAVRREIQEAIARLLEYKREIDAITAEVSDDSWILDEHEGDRVST